MLSKYDEEIDGEKKKSFRLSTGGCAAGDRERELQAIRESLRDQAQSLQLPALTIASEYYTPQEMVSTGSTSRWCSGEEEEEECVWVGGGLPRLNCRSVLA